MKIKHKSPPLLLKYKEIMEKQKYLLVFGDKKA